MGDRKLTSDVFPMEEADRTYLTTLRRISFDACSKAQREGIAADVRNKTKTVLSAAENLGIIRHAFLRSDGSDGTDIDRTTIALKIGKSTLHSMMSKWKVLVEDLRTTKTLEELMARSEALATIITDLRAYITRV